MKVLKVLTALFAAAIISFSVQAQSSTTQTAKPASTTKTPTGKPAAKPTDPVNKSLKGPNGEVVYTGSRGGNYYLDKNGNKKYIPKK